jgi:glyoxylase-like metal-dependent hydrolase (beta-lactamase superfamily II)
MMDIYQVRGRLGNSYIVAEDDRFFVVDVALRGEKYVTGFFRDVLGQEMGRIELVVCTHDDQDHSGGIYGLARECGASVGLPYAAHAPLKKIIHNPLGLFYRPVTAIEESLRPRMWKMYFDPHRRNRYGKKPMRLVRFPSRPCDRYLRPDHFLKHNQQLPGFPGWRVIHTPGHSWDSCSFFHAQTGSLLSGDTLLGSEKAGKVFLPSIYANPQQMRRTVKKLKRLNPSHIYPGHGITFHGTGLLDHLVTGHRPGGEEGPPSATP